MKVDSCLLELFLMFGFPNFFLFNLSLLIVDIVPAGTPVRFTCLCLSVMRSCLLYSIFGLAWLFISGELLALRVTLIVLVVGKIWIRLLKHIIDGVWRWWYVISVLVFVIGFYSESINEGNKPKTV